MAKHVDVLELLKEARHYVAGQQHGIKSHKVWEKSEPFNLLQRIDAVLTPAKQKPVEATVQPANAVEAGEQVEATE